MRRTSKTIAISLRNLLYWSDRRAGLPEADRKQWAARRQSTLSEWREVDPEGFRIWAIAMRIARRGHVPLTGWAGMVEAESGIRLADPCEYCQECRSSR